MKIILSNIENLTRKTSQVCRRVNYPRKVAFMHIPKCAGSSIMEALRESDKMAWEGHVDGPKTRSDYVYYYLDNQLQNSFLEVEKEIYKFRQTLLIEKFNKNYPIISGHVPFLHSLKSNYSSYFFFTVVRNPIDRFLSAFNFALQLGKLEAVNLDLVQARGIDYSFEKYLESEQAILEGNLLTLFLGEYGKEKLDFTVLEKRAYMGVTCFDFIGTSENVKEISNTLKKNKLIQHEIGKTNVTKAINHNQVKTTQNLTNFQKNKIQELCQRDDDIYSFILDKFP